MCDKDLGENEVEWTGVVEPRTSGYQFLGEATYSDILQALQKECLLDSFGLFAEGA